MTSPLIDQLRLRCRHDARSTAIVQGARSVTYGELEVLTRRWVAWLAERGIGKGDAVLVFVPPSIELYAILLALWWRGAVAVFADAWTTRHRMALVAEQVRPKLLIGIPRALALRVLIPGLRDVPTKYLWPWRMLPGPSRAPEPASLTADASALVTFTTGSSGTPKGADRTHEFLLAQHRALMEALGDVPAGAELVTLPIFGLHALASGRTCVLAPIAHATPAKYPPRRMLRALRRHRPVAMAASPAVFETLIEYLEKTGQTVGLPIRLHVGGAAVTRALMGRLRGVFPNAWLTAVYGSTEAEPIALVDGDALAATPDSPDGGLPVGRPYAGTQVRIVPVDESVPGQCSEAAWRNLALPPGQVGEICVAGAHVLTRYYNQGAGGDARKVRVGNTVWQRTGDAGAWDADGSLVLHGTVAQSFRWAGRRWYPFPFEGRLNELREVEKATLVCTARGPVVCVEPRTGVGRDALRSAIQSLGLPFRWRLWLGRIPRDPRHNSKVDHGRLLEQVA